MIMNLKLLLIFLFSIIMFNCSDEPTSVGDGLIGDKINLKIINSTDDSLSQYSSSYHQTVRLGSAERLLLGKSDNINASILIRFQTGLPDSIAEDIKNNSIVINSALMQLNQNYRFGEESALFDFTVHKVTANWGLNFNEDSISSLNYESQDLALSKEINDSVTSVTIDNLVVWEWLQIAADSSLPDDKGIYLKPAEGTQKILGYQALTSSFTNYPTVSVEIEKPGIYVDTLILFTTIDVGVVEGTMPDLSEGNIMLRSGYVINSKLVFDLSTIPKKVIINKAELTLTIDTLETKVGTSYTNLVQAVFLFDSTNTDSLAAAAAALGRSGNKFVGTITAFVREWIRNDNQGMILTTGNPLSGAELFSIKGSNSANLSERPLLKITYTMLE